MIFSSARIREALRLRAHLSFGTVSCGKKSEPGRWLALQKIVPADTSGMRSGRVLSDILSLPDELANTTPVIIPGRGDYRTWITLFDTLSYLDRLVIAERIGKMSRPPTISVVVPAYNTPEHILRRCIESVQRQLYPYWKLCIVDDASSQPHVARLCEAYARCDQRIHFRRRETNGHIAAATNSALEFASGEFVAFLDHDDLLAPHALYVVAEELRRDPEVDLIFTDEDKVDETGVRYDPWFKPDWNYDLMLSQNAVVHLAVFRRSIINDIGGLRSGFDGSQDYDLVLRFSERIPSKRIRHIPFILYHWRAVPGSVALAEGEKAYAYDAAERALREHLARQGVTAEVEKQSHPGYYRVRWPLPAQQPRVSIIIPTRDKVDLLRTAIGSVRALTSYDDYEIVVVDNCSVEKRTQQYLQEIGDDPRVRVLKYDRPYSYAALNNWAAAQTDSPLIAFLNNDIEVISSSGFPKWPLTPCGRKWERSEQNSVPDKTLQHAGVVVGIGIGQVIRTFASRATAPAILVGRSAYSSSQRLLRPVWLCAVTSFSRWEASTKSISVSRSTMSTSGYGLPRLDTPWFGLRMLNWFITSLLHSGLRATQNAELYSSLSWPTYRGSRPRTLDNDPFYNPNLTIYGGDFSPAFPPRVRRPWRFH